MSYCCCSSGVEHFLGKEEVESSILFNSSKEFVGRSPTVFEIISTRNFHYGCVANIVTYLKIHTAERQTNNPYSTGISCLGCSSSL